MPKITEYQQINALQGTDLVPVVDDITGNPTTRKANIGQIVDYAENNGRATMVADVVADGVADDTAALQDACDQAAADGKLLILPPGTIRTTAAIDVATSRFSIMGTSTILRPDGNTYTGLTIGPASGQSSLSETGSVRNLRIFGGTSPDFPPTQRTGSAGLRIRGMIDYRVKEITVRGFDMGFDLINNCYGTSFTDIRAGYNGNCNIGLNLRTGGQSGSDIPVRNAWLSGRTAAVYMASGGGGYRFYDGHFGAGQNGSSVVPEGVFVIGKDWLTQAIGQSGVNTFVATGCEGWHLGPAIRMFGDSRCQFIGISFYSSRTDAKMPSRILHWTDPGRSQATFVGCDVGGHYTAADLALIDGTGTSQPEFYIFETGWTSSGGTVAGVSKTTGWLTSLTQQSGHTRGLGFHRGGSAGAATIQLGGNRIRMSGDTLQTSPLTTTRWVDVGGIVTKNTQTGTAYTLTLDDAGRTVELDNAAAVTVTVPPNSSVAFPVGSVVELHQYGAGAVTVAAGAGVTIRSLAGALALEGRYSSAVLRKRATDEWVLVGGVG